MLITLEIFGYSSMLLFLFIQISHTFSDFFFLVLLNLNVGIKGFLSHLNRAFILSGLMVIVTLIVIDGTIASDHRLVLLYFGYGLVKFLVVLLKP